MEVGNEDEYAPDPFLETDSPTSPSEVLFPFAEPKLGRERSTSAPNICQNAVNIPGQYDVSQMIA